MPKLILFALLLLIIKTSSAQTANDQKELIIAPYTIWFKGLIGKDTITKQQLLSAGKGRACRSF